MLVPCQARFVACVKHRVPCSQALYLFRARALTHPAACKRACLAAFLTAGRLISRRIPAPLLPRR